MLWITCLKRFYDRVNVSESCWNETKQPSLRTQLTITHITIITTRNEVGARLCFHRRVWFCSQGGLPQCMLGYHPPGSRHPLRSRHPPPEQTMLGDTVNARAVRILLECNLVLKMYLFPANKTPYFLYSHLSNQKMYSSFNVESTCIVGFCHTPVVCMFRFWIAK